MEDSKLKVISTEQVVTDDLIIAGTNQIDLTKILNIAMGASAIHDLYLQEQLNVQFIKENQTWVITQYEINIVNEAKVGDQLVFDTRLVEVNRFFCTRRYSVCHDGALLYEIYAKFAAIDLEKRRIARINPSSLESPKIIDQSFTVDFNKLSPFTKAVTDDAINIDIDSKDIDENMHVNNLVYLRWAYRVLPDTIMDAYKLSKIEVKYEKEILPEDSVAICNDFGMNEENKIQQVIMNQTTGKVACIINMQFVNK